MVSGAGLIDKTKFRSVEVEPLLTVARKYNSPVLVGVPEIVAVAPDEVTLRPLRGKVGLKLHTKEEVGDPPVALIVTLYGTPDVASGSGLVVVIDSGSLI